MTRRIDAYSLRLFVSTARAGSIVRGAALEHIAPSALSRRIADLEHAFGTALFVRSPRGVALTDAGRLVLERGQQIDNDLQSLVREVQIEGDEVRGTVRLYANMSAVIGFLPERLQAFMARYPRVQISLHEEDTRDVIRACLDDRADVGVGVEAPVPAGLDAWRFATDPLQVVLPAGHALAKRKAVGFAELLDHPLIGVHQGGALDRCLHERAQALQKKPLRPPCRSAASMRSAAWSRRAWALRWFRKAPPRPMPAARASCAGRSTKRGRRASCISMRCARRQGRARSRH